MLAGNHGSCIQYLEPPVFILMNTTAMIPCISHPGGIPYMGKIGMCGPKGYGFPAVLVIDRVLILADFGYLGRK